MKKILVVVDMQNDFIDGSLGSPEAVKTVPNAIREIENFDGKIFATLDTHYENYMETSEGKHLPVMHCVKDTLGHRINPEIRTALVKKGYLPVEKNTFGSVTLPKIIKDAFLDEELDIELIGLCTDICVVSNALMLKANFPEARISVKADCCAGVTPEKHEAALETMRSCQIEVI